MELLYLADVRETPFVSTARKPKSSENDKSGIPNSQLGTYLAKVLGDIKAGGVADGKDVGGFDEKPPREPLSFRPEKYRRAVMVGDLALGDDIAGIADEYADSLSDQMTLHKRDMERECYSDQDSSLNGGLEGGTKMRGLGRWINDGTLAFSELPVAAGARTPAAQLYLSVIGDGISTGLTEAVAQALLENRWQNTGTSNELMGFVGSIIKNRFGFFSRYTPNVTNATPIVRTASTTTYPGGEFYGPSIDVYKSDYGAWTLMAVNTTFLPDAYRGYFLDMSMVELRSRYWARSKELPDLGGGPRELLESFVALIPGDPRSHVKIAATA
jgi:hypothetical protein